MTPRIRFANPVIFVKEIEISKSFYTEMIGLKIIQDASVFVLFEDHFSIHQAQELSETVFGCASAAAQELQGRENLLLYFESEDIEQTFSRIEKRVNLIHPIEKQAWGQRVFRFYDPDRHIIEIGEPSVFQF
jgi:predicted enzyme related to lactoylglutathione lyase